VQAPRKVQEPPGTAPAHAEDQHHRQQRHRDYEHQHGRRRPVQPSVREHRPDDERRQTHQRETRLPQGVRVGAVRVHRLARAVDHEDTDGRQSQHHQEQDVGLAEGAVGARGSAGEGTVGRGGGHGAFSVTQASSAEPRS